MRLRGYKTLGINLFSRPMFPPSPESLSSVYIIWNIKLSKFMTLLFHILTRIVLYISNNATQQRMTKNVAKQQHHNKLDIWLWFFEDYRVATHSRLYWMVSGIILKLKMIGQL